MAAGRTIAPCSAEYAYQCGYLNSIWQLGIVDAPLRYSVKLGMALVWTIGPALMFVPAGAMRLRRLEHGGFLALAMAAAAVPALGSHLLVQFGSPGWCFHYVPALIALTALGVNRASARMPAPRSTVSLDRLLSDPAPARLIAMAVFLAALFWLYPTNFDRPGWRGSFDLSFCRFTRTGLKTPILHRSPAYWRTANSRSPVRPTSRLPTDLRAGEG